MKFVWIGPAVEAGQCSTEMGLETFPPFWALLSLNSWTGFNYLYVKMWYCAPWTPSFETRPPRWSPQPNLLRINTIQLIDKLRLLAKTGLIFLNCWKSIVLHLFRSKKIRFEKIWNKICPVAVELALSLNNNNSLRSLCMYVSCMYI